MHKKRTRGTSANHPDQHLIGEAEKIVAAIGKMFAPCCEVVLHDLTHPKNSIVAIENPLSGRKIGDSTTEMGLARIRNPAFPDIVQNYANAFPDGRPAKSTSIGLRNAQGKFIGAICMNLDISLFSSVQLVLQQFAATQTDKTPIKESLRDRSSDEIRQAIQGFAAQHNMQPRALPPLQRRALIQKLSQNGLLQLRGAAAIIAEILGISRASIYNALKD